MLVFLFLERIRFPRMKSIVAIIRSRYGDKVLKMVKKLEKLDFELRKAQNLILNFYVILRIMILYLIFFVFEQLIKTYKQ